MLTLYDYQPSLNGWKIRVLLRLLALPFRIREVALFQGENRSEAIMGLNPVGAIPILQLDDGRSLAESSAILWYLAEGTRYLPDELYERARVLQWLSFEQYYVEPTIGSLRFWTLTGRLGLNAGRMVVTRRENGERAINTLERGLRNQLFLVGADLTIADIALYAYTHRAEDCGFEISSFPAVCSWLERVSTILGPGHPIAPYTSDAMFG